MNASDKELDEPNKVKVAKCPICNGNVSICGIDSLDGNDIRSFVRHKEKEGCILTFITIREAREQPMCFRPNKCDKIESRNCDGCGQKFKGEGHKMYNENHVEQDGLLCCDGCYWGEDKID